MSPPASERAERIARGVPITSHVAPLSAARTARRAVPTYRTAVAHHPPREGHRAAMSPPASERAERIARAVPISSHVAPLSAARTAQRAVPTYRAAAAHP